MHCNREIFVRPSNFQKGRVGGFLRYPAGVAGEPRPSYEFQSRLYLNTTNKLMALKKSPFPPHDSINTMKPEVTASAAD